MLLNESGQVIEGSERRALLQWPGPYGGGPRITFRVVSEGPVRPLEDRQLDRPEQSPDLPGAA